MKTTRKTLFHLRIGYIAIMFTIYLCVYITDSVFGGYNGPVAGNLLYSSGLAANTVFLWQPRFGYVDGRETSLLGKLFFPIIRVDQRYFHPALDLNFTNDYNLLFATNNDVRWHPLALEHQKDLRIAKALWRSECIDNPSFCLESAVDFHSAKDTHFIALMLYDAFGTNTLDRLKIVENGVSQKLFKEHVERVASALAEVEKKTILSDMHNKK